MREKYITPELEIVEFAVEDIITTSNETPMDDLTKQLLGIE